MAAVRLLVLGDEQLVAAFARARDEGMKAEIASANKLAADVVVQRARPNVPVGATGNLRESVRPLGSRTAAKANVRAGSARVPYAATIHWGRKRRGVVKARPYLWDAMNDALKNGELERGYRDAMERLLDEIARAT